MENVCRTCLRIIGSTYSISYLNKTNKKTEAVSIREKLESCVPELTLDIVVEPAICSTCSSALSLAYQFKSTCIQTEKTLYTCIKRRQKLIPSCTDLLSVKDLLKIARKDISSEHNYSYVERYSPAEVTASDSDSDSNYESKRSTAKLSTNVQTSLNAIVQDSDVESPSKNKSKLATKRSSSKEVHQNGSTSREHSKETKQKEQDSPSNKQSNTKEVNKIKKEIKVNESAGQENKKDHKNVVSKESSTQFKQQMKELQDRQKVKVEKVSQVVRKETRESQSKQKVTNTSKEVKVVETPERRKTVGHLKEVPDKQKSGASRVSLPEVKQVKASTNVVVESPRRQKTAAELKQHPTRETQRVVNTEKETNGSPQRVANVGKETNNSPQRVASTRKETNPPQIVASVPSQTTIRESKSSGDHKQTDKVENAPPVDKGSADSPNVKNRTVESKKVNCSTLESPKSSSTPRVKVAKHVTYVAPPVTIDEPVPLNISEIDIATTPTVEASPSRGTRSLTKVKPRKKATPRKIPEKLSSSRTGRSPQKLSRSESQHGNRRASEGKAKAGSTKSRRSLNHPIPLKKSLDKIIQKLKEHADHDCGPIVNIDNSPKKMPKILPLAEVSTSKVKSQENSKEIGATSKAVQHEIGAKKRKAFNIERRQIGIKRSCRENRKPVEVKTEENEFSEEDIEAGEETKPIKIDISAEEQEDISHRVTKLVDRDGIVTYQCTRCLKIYRYMSHFEVHERAHILTKLLSCHMCNKSFSHQKHLKAHLMIHKNLGPYKCRLCSKRLSSTTALKRHLLTHTGEKAFNCSICQKAFAQKIQLAVHMRIHTGIRPFSCDICEAMFTQKSHLMGHVKVHTGEKPYKCDLCWKQFRKPYALSMHKECHQRKPFQCKSCDFLVKDVETFKRHIHKHLLGRLPLKNRTNKPKQMIINELKEDFKNVNKLKKELKTE